MSESYRSLTERHLRDARLEVDLPVREIRDRIANAVYDDGSDPDNLHGLFGALTLKLRIDHVLTAMHRFGTVRFDGSWNQTCSPNPSATCHRRASRGWRRCDR
jgi:hypothetical protein